jgi:transcription antitermination factor NusG
MSYWTVAYTDVAAEPVARREIEAQGFGVFLPHYRVGTWRGDRLHVRHKPLFPRYVFVHVPDDVAWPTIAAADGVNRVLMAEGEPARVPSTAIAEVMLAHASGLYNAIAPRPGDARRRRRRRRRPRPGKVAKGTGAVLSPRT